MEIQSDLIILPATNYLPLPWSVRGPLGLETGAEVSIALVHSGGTKDGLPDIIITPLQSDYLSNTYTLDVELGERAGAVSAFLTWLGDGIESKTDNSVNIVLSETITLEGRNKHKMHIVLEPASSKVVELDEIKNIIDEIRSRHSSDVHGYEINPVYSTTLSLMLEQTVPVKNGWIQYGDWKKRILERYPDAEKDYDLGRVVVSSNPEQRLLRFIIPKRGVLELRIPHRNRPGALKEISRVIGEENFNILSSRLSRTPPKGRTGKTSVFVAACEPLNLKNESAPPIEQLRQRLRLIDTKYSIDMIDISHGKDAHRTLFLTPRRQEMVQIDHDIATDRQIVRAEIGKAFLDKYHAVPLRYIFLSRRFIDNTAKTRAFYEEQRRCVGTIIKAIEDEGCAVIEAANPGQDENRHYDLQVYKAVFSRLWASDACAVLALNEDGRGSLSLSIAHEIGFFAGRNRPLKVFVAASRDKDPVFGNIVGLNRVTYADGDAGFVDDNIDALYRKVRNWVKSIVAMA